MANMYLAMLDMIQRSRERHLAATASGKPNCSRCLPPSWRALSLRRMTKLKFAFPACNASR
jgi:hypothetical protein